MDISPEDWETWTELFKDAIPRVRGPLRSAAEVDAVVDLLYQAFNSACSAVMKRKSSAPAHNSRWWTPACAEAARAVTCAPTQALKDAAAKDLKTTVRTAKRQWADDYITTANVWEVAAWRHGRRQTRIPALVDAHGDLTFDHASMSDIFAERFFARDPGDIPLAFPDDPPTRPTRPFAPITAEEAHALLSRTSNTSSPGDSGIGWELLKRGWGPAAETFTSVYNACLTLGHHPAVWKNAVVVVIPKPDRPDYTQAKAHRPISLLETMSKLLEKVVAQRMQHDIVTEELIPTTQFGGRRHSSCLDAGLTLLHDVQAAHSAGLKCGIVLFDVKGFFDHVNHARLVQVVRQMGFAPEMCGWMSAFLRDRKVSLRFNNLLASERDQPVGVPQGSPISPVLSVAYTSSLLHKMGSWTNSSLGMYVDDGILFACADNWEAVQDTLRSRYAICEEWLRRVGLSAEPDKTELLYFQKPFERNVVPAPSSITLPCAGGTYEVRAVETLRYLGFFINRRLKWEPHVRIMCNRARASIKALMVLGNSIRGLSMANWRLVLNAVCLPVMTYGCQLWYKENGTKGLVNMLQKVHNDMVKVVSGAFRTAPREALLQLTRMLPMRHHLDKLTHTSALRLYRLPRASQLLRRLGPHWYVPGRSDHPLVVARASAGAGRSTQRPTALEALAARIPSDGPRVNVTSVPPWEVPNWVGHLSFMGVVSPWVRTAWTRDLTNSVEGLSILISHAAAVLSNRGRNDDRVAGGAAATFSVGGSPLSILGWSIGDRLTQFDADVFAIAKTAEALACYYTEGVPTPDNMFILSPSSSALMAVKNPRSTSSQAASLMFHQALTTLTLHHRATRFYLVWTPVDADLEGQRVARVIAAEACLQDPPEGLHKVQSAAYQKARARERAFNKWEQDYHFDRAKNALQLRATGLPLDGAAFTHAITNPPSGGNHPLWKAAVAVETDEHGRKTRRPKYPRRVTSTALQLAVDHAFTGSYAARFRPSDPPESLLCPCGAPLRTPQHLTWSAGGSSNTVWTAASTPFTAPSATHSCTRQSRTPIASSPSCSPVTRPSDLKPARRSPHPLSPTREVYPVGLSPLYTRDH
jgi:hypothetical protein